ncbi:hypothetical protein OESDEN_14979, partial [Oesophagostomum dentatum]
LFVSKKCLVTTDSQVIPFIVKNWISIYSHTFQSGSDSDGESTSIRKSSTSSYQALAEKPQFSLKQVRMICERLLKEQEMRLRYEYELALNQKLDG